MVMVGKCGYSKTMAFKRLVQPDTARRFFESAELVEIRKKAGVKAPEFIYLHAIERGVL